jgi:hypothetical protein
MSRSFHEAMKALATGIAGILIGLLARDVWHSYAWSATLGAHGSSAARGPEHEPPQCAFDWARLRTELRGAALDDRGRRQATQAVAEPVAAPTAEQTQALAEHAKLLDRAIKAGVWREEDAMLMRMMLSQMAPKDRFGALTAVHRAINEGRLKVEAKIPF